MRGILKQAGLFLLCLLVLVALLAGWLVFGLKPDTKDLVASAFRASGKDSLPVSQLVNVIDESAARTSCPREPCISSTNSRWKGCASAR